MPKAHKKVKSSAEQKVAPAKPLFNMQPWSCIHKPGEFSAIEAYVEAVGDWKTIATVPQTAFLDAEKTAEFIAKAVNDRTDMQGLIDEMTEALESCLACDGLTWEAEHDAEILVRRAKERRKTA